MKEENMWYCCTDQSVHVVEVKWCLGEDCRVVAAWCLYTGGDSQPSARDQQPLPPPLLAPSVRPAAPPVDNDLINWVNHEYYRSTHSLTDQKEIKKNTRWTLYTSYKLHFPYHKSKKTTIVFTNIWQIGLRLALLITNILINCL